MDVKATAPRDYEERCTILYHIKYDIHINTTL